MNSLLSVVGLLIGLSLSAAAFADQTTYVPGKFEPGLAGWFRIGQADFAPETHDGKAAARITVAPYVPIQYQQLRFEITNDLRKGDAFRIAASVRAEGVADGSGPYLALEFVDRNGERITIAHSRVGRDTGGKGWDRLEAEGTAPEGVAAVRFSLILHAHGTAWFATPEMVRTGREEIWPDLGNARRTIRIRADRPALGAFGGLGFHAFHHIFAASAAEMDEIIYKRWRELRPTFVRINHECTWDRAMLDRVAEHLLRMKETGTEVYVTTWDPPDAHTPEEYAAHARLIADHLDYLIHTRHCTNIRYYCCTNELSLQRWGAMMEDLPRFKAFHQALYGEFQRRRLPVGLLATDASPLSYWSSIEWAANNMDPITAVYGGHHYIAEYDPEDDRFYPWFLGKLQWGAAIARSKHKPFIMGEFGSKQDGRTIDGILRDVCIYYETPREPAVGLQVAEASIAAINAGIYSTGYWTFMDLPDDYAKGYINKWGLFRDSGADRSTRAPYYAYGLLTKFLRGPAHAYAVECADPRLRAAAMQHDGSGDWSLAVVSRNNAPAPVTFHLTVAEQGSPGAAPPITRVRKYVYDPQHVPQHRFGDLQPAAAILKVKGGRWSDTLAPGTLTVYTSEIGGKLPRVTGLTAATVTDGVRLNWQTGAKRAAAYYRIYRAATPTAAPLPEDEIGTTVAAGFVDHTPDAVRPFYLVVPVNDVGDAGPAARTR